ncbi:hypothetical protein C8R47DRAFT_991349 [Mycena vitilis]|nr:hypothetical protein C8R47DRAFT_991349 [Mycena vitilis]
MDPFSTSFLCYRQLLYAETSGQRGLTFPAGVVCRTCLADGASGTFKHCSTCKTVLYCSKECQMKDWKGCMHPYEPHKVWCSVFKSHMGCMSEVQSIIRSFPWGRVEEDGTFFDELARARIGLLGGKGFGFWSQSGLGLFEDDEDDQFTKARKLENPAANWARWNKKRENQKKIQFINGQDLLKDNHLTDREGWKLPVEQVVHRDFLGAQPPRRRLSLLRNWDDWHSWRKVPKSSPASLLMHYPLSIYWMLTDTLKVASSGSESRVHLTVHYIGAEVELNFIPIFAEIAILLPRHDVDLVLFGPCVYYLGLEGAKSEHQSSLIGRSVRDSRVPIFTYDAPEACGSGSIRVLLHTATKHWTIPDLPSYGPKPDAILACNAGLFTYDASREVMAAALGYKIPFAVTDYQQYMLESNASSISKIGITLPPVKLNPFHRPGQRSVGRSVLTPSLENGFVLAVFT